MILQLAEVLKHCILSAILAKRLFANTQHQEEWLTTDSVTGHAMQRRPSLQLAIVT